jgi:inorganic pyrophosphatase
MKHGRAWLKKVRPIGELDQPFVVVSEIPAGSRCKYALDMATGHLELGRIMAPGVTYPTNYGFVPRTRSSDAMELDVMIMTTEPLLPLTTVEVRVVGGLTIHDDGEDPEHKLLAFATCDPTLGHVTELDHVDGELLDRIESFYTTYKQVEGKTVAFLGWADREKALKWLKAALKAVK